MQRPVSTSYLPQRCMLVLLVLIVLLVLSLIAGPGVLAGKSSQKRPYSVVLDIQYEGRKGPASFTRELAATLIRELSDALCFDSVVLLNPESTQQADLVLQVRLEDYFESMSHETNLASVYSPDRHPDVAHLQVATIESEFFLQFLRQPSGALVNSRRFKLGTSHRPLLDEDPRTEARLQLIDDAARKIRLFACKGKASAFIRKFDAAQATD